MGGREIEQIYPDIKVGDTVDVNQFIAVLAYGWNGLTARGIIPVNLPVGKYSVAVRNSNMNIKKTESNALTNIVGNISSFTIDSAKGWCAILNINFNSAPVGTASSVICLSGDVSITRTK